MAAALGCAYTPVARLRRDTIKSTHTDCPCRLINVRSFHDVATMGDSRTSVSLINIDQYDRFLNEDNSSRCESHKHDGRRSIKTGHY